MENLTGIKKNQALRLLLRVDSFNNIPGSRISKDGSAFIPTENIVKYVDDTLIQELVTIEANYTEVASSYNNDAQGYAGQVQYNDFAGMISRYTLANTALADLVNELEGAPIDYSTAIPDINASIAANQLAIDTANASDNTPTNYVAADNARYTSLGIYYSIYNTYETLGRYIDLTASEMDADSICIEIGGPGGELISIYTIYAAPGSGATAQEVWEYGTRELTAGSGISMTDIIENEADLPNGPLTVRQAFQLLIKRLKRHKQSPKL